MTYGNEFIYLDHAATTPVDSAVLRVMLPFFSQHFGNPSSIYRLGQDAKAGIETARRQVANALGSRPSEILFTSGATESINLALRGVIRAQASRRPDLSGTRLISTPIEHHAALHEIDALRADGAQVDYLPVNAEGLVDPQELARMLVGGPATLVSVMYANNEHGAIQQVSEIGAIARAHGVPLHVDAVQAAGLLPLDVNELRCDLLSLSAHKFYGPKGVGVLYVRKGTRIEWQQLGGGQESGRRGGTENVPLIAGMGEALKNAEALRDAYTHHCRELRDHLWRRIFDLVPDVTLNGPPLDGPRLPNNLNISIAGVQGETVLLALDMAGVAASAGSACTTGNSEPSHVLLASGLSELDARSSLRLTVGRGNSLDEMETAAQALAETVTRIRDLAGVG
jgi:cysteine desulfurase